MSPRGLMLLPLCLPGAAFAAKSVVIDDIRVQVLSPTLVRIEQKGPLGFEDRQTFTVVARNWRDEVKIKVVRTAKGTTIVAPHFSVIVPTVREGLKGIRVHTPKGDYAFGDKLPSAHQWLPDPGKLPATFVLPDSPRMIPAPEGAIPGQKGGDPALEATSGYDTRNNAADAYVFVPQSYTGFRKEFLKLTGPIPMVPRYAFGFWDSRWFPYTQDTALATIDTYRSKHIPLDLFVVDTDWRVGASDGYAPNTKLFSDLPKFLSDAHKHGVRVMFNDHPEPQTPTALDPKETQFRWDGHTEWLKAGLDVWWFDRNWWTSLHEPMPGISKEVWGESVFHDITAAVRPNKRPMIMANMEGINNGIRAIPPRPEGHRYPIWWTGDTTAQWKYLRYGVENAVDGGVTSFAPYMGEDLGGHMGIPTHELYVRYLQYGCLSPTARVHCTRGLTRYPWAFGPEVEERTKDSIKFRYRLIPTFYAAARKAYEDGTPILRRLDLEFPSLPMAKSNHEYLLGDDLLVAPIIGGEEGTIQPVTQLLKTESGEPGLNAELFDNEKLEGKPKLTRVDKDIQFNWGEGAPAPGMPTDHFSIRWTGKIGPMPATKEYNFGALSDDGCRVWIDGKELINEWHDADSNTYQAKMALQQGKSYDLKVEYYEGGGSAAFKFGLLPPLKSNALSHLWVPPGTWIDPWTGVALRSTGVTTIDATTPIYKVPMLVRAGAVLFLGPDVEMADKQIGAPVRVELFPGNVGQEVRRTFYEDDGVSNDYIKDGFIKRTAVWDATKSGYHLRLAPTVGWYHGQPARRDWALRVHLPANKQVVSVTVDGKKFPFKVEAPGNAPKSLLGLFGALKGTVVNVSLKSLPEKNGSDIVVKTAK